LSIRFVHVLLAHVLLSLNRQYWMGKIVVKDVEFLSRRTHIESFSDIFRYYSSCTFFRLFLKDGWSQTYTVLCLLFLYLLVFFFFIIHRRRLFVCNAYISFFRLGRYFIFFRVFPFSLIIRMMPNRWCRVYTVQRLQRGWQKKIQFFCHLSWQKTQDN
jgi:hypothetical protein